MGYGLYDYDRRRRRRHWSGLFKFLTIVGGIGGIAGFSYLVGVEQMKSRTGSLEQEVQTLTEAKDQVDRRAQQLQQIAQEAEIRMKEMEVRLQREVPQGDLAKLRDLLAQKLTEGVEAQRLAFVIERTGRARNCAKPETKRFVLATPLYRGANTSVGFAEGAVNIVGQGVSDKDTTGNAEAWFDPRQPVTLRFTTTDGQTTEATGLLPLQHSVVSGDKEHRFRIVNSNARSFVDITAETCPFP